MSRGLLWILAIAPGCALVSDADLAARMDLDGDGIERPADCDDTDPTVGELTFYADGDGDGYGGSVEVEACAPPGGAAWLFLGGAD